MYGVTVQPVMGPFSMPSSDEAPQVPTKRGYRHHPKPDSQAPERPYSAYVLFSNQTRDQLKDQSLSFTELSRQVGERWQALSPEERDYWKQKAAIPWEKYKADLAQYQKTEQYQEYLKYLGEFKAAEARKHPEKKQGSTHRQSPLLCKKPGNAGGSSEASLKPVETRRQRAPIDPSVEASEATRASKLPIKRLKQEPGEPQARKEANRSTRVRQACEPCRQRKIKCHGEQPTCRHCHEVGAKCYYESSKREGKKQYRKCIVCLQVKANQDVGKMTAFCAKLKYMRISFCGWHRRLTMMIRKLFRRLYYRYLILSRRFYTSLLTLDSRHNLTLPLTHTKLPLPLETTVKAATKSMPHQKPRALVQWVLRIM